MKIRAWTSQHKNMIHDFLLYLNHRSKQYILKGGTALMMCYELDRFSEDIDLDGLDKYEIKNIINDYSHQHNLNYRISKDIDTTKRFFLHYDNIKPLKIEVSYRRKYIDISHYHKMNDIIVYNINELASMKAIAYSGRDKIRDLYDLSFICNRYWKQLSNEVQSIIRTTVEYKGIEQFDYLINIQEDELINNDKLVVDFLNMYNKLDLLDSDTSNIKNNDLDNSNQWDMEL